MRAGSRPLARTASRWARRTRTRQAAACVPAIGSSRCSRRSRASQVSRLPAGASPQLRLRRLPRSRRMLRQMSWHRRSLARREAASLFRMRRQFSQAGASMCGPDRSRRVQCHTAAKTHRPSARTIWRAAAHMPRQMQGGDAASKKRCPQYVRQMAGSEAIAPARRPAGCQVRSPRPQTVTAQCPRLASATRA